MSAAGAQGWQGVQTLPRVVSLDYDTPAMIMAPPAEIESLRLAQLFDAQGATLGGASSTRARPRAALCAQLRRRSLGPRAWQARQRGSGCGSRAALRRCLCSPAAEVQQSRFS